MQDSRTTPLRFDANRAAGTLHVESAGRFYLFLGVDDGEDHDREPDHDARPRHGGPEGGVSHEV